jgi:hypothetical protein
MNLRRRALSLAAVAALALALVPTPAFGASLASLPEWACRPGDTGPADSFAGRDGKVREKDLAQTHNDLPPRARGKAPANLSVTVPVWFHVVTNGSVGDLTDRQIDAQIRVLNTEFGGSDTGFSFDLAGVTRTNDATWYASKSGGAEHDMKLALKTGGDGTLNVYSTSAGAYLGWAYLPEITDTAQAYLDGVVFSWETVPGASDTYAGVYDQGMTLVHEVGHWLNLEHTFYGGCNKSGDFVADTPAMKSPTFGCPAGKDTCPKAPGLDPVHNYMDYSDDPCLTEFTPGQAQRMQDSWLFYRAS